MAVVLRLQGLNIDAGPEDIRRFFDGLPIPKGGVHITGGETGEAFIIFETDIAGNLAMMSSGKQLKGSTVRLRKSCMNELKHSIELKLRKRKCAPFKDGPNKPSATENLATILLNIATAIKDLQSNIQMNHILLPLDTTQVTTIPKLGENGTKMSPVLDPHVNKPMKVAESSRQSAEVQQQEAIEVTRKPGYLRLYGLPSTITKEEVCQFLKGLNVVDVMPDKLGRVQCCLVKMATFNEAELGLKYSHRSPKDLPVEVRLAHERMWKNAMESRERFPCSPHLEPDRFSLDRRLRRHFPVERHSSFSESTKRCRTAHLIQTTKRKLKTSTKTEKKPFLLSRHTKE